MSDPRPSVLVSVPLGERVRARLAESAEIAEELGHADGALVDSGVRVDRALLDAAPRLRIVASTSVGYDRVDVAELGRRGIAFANGRGALNDAVADLTLALIVMQLRRLPELLAWTRAGSWMRDAPPYATDLAEKTLGIVGMGEIGCEVARRAQAAKMRVIYANRRPREDDAARGTRFVPFDDLLARSDVVVALLPLTPQTRGTFDARAFARMKPTAHFVNVARGAIADTDALARALHDGVIAGAALDVVDPEPLPPDHPLFAAPNLVVTPHVGSATVETRERMALLAVANLAAFFAGEPLLTPIATTPPT